MPDHLPTPEARQQEPISQSALPIKHRLDQGKPASERLRGAPTEGKAQKGMARDAAEGKLPAAPQGPEAGIEPWKEAHPCMGGTLSPSYPQAHLSHPTALRGPTLARCGPPVGTEFIFLNSYDNTGLCLFNFLLWMEERWARKISLAPFDQNTAAHTSCKDTHTETLPLHHPKNTSGPLLAGAGLGALQRLLGAKQNGPRPLHRLCPGPGSSQAVSQVVL